METKTQGCNRQRGWYAVVINKSNKRIRPHSVIGLMLVIFAILLLWAMVANGETILDSPRGTAYIAILLVGLGLLLIA